MWTFYRIKAPSSLWEGFFVPGSLVHSVYPDLLGHARAQGVTPAALAVYTAMLSYRNRETGTAWPRQATLAERIGISTRLLRRHLRQLLDAGLLALVQRTGRCNVYAFPGADEAGADRSERNTPFHTERNTPFHSHKKELEKEQKSKVVSPEPPPPPLEPRDGQTTTSPREDGDHDPSPALREALASALTIQQAWDTQQPAAPEAMDARRLVAHYRQQLRWTDEAKWAGQQLADLPDFTERGRGGMDTLADLIAARQAGPAGPHTSDRWKRAVRSYCAYHRKHERRLGSFLGWIAREGGETERAIARPEIPSMPEPSRPDTADEPETPWARAVDTFSARTGAFSLAAHLHQAETTLEGGRLRVALSNAWATRLWLDAPPEITQALAEAAKETMGAETIDLGPSAT